MSAPSDSTRITSLKDFQQRTVEHALERLYAEDSAGRFLVADEVGTGKTLVARGVIEGAIDHLQTVPSVERIDILYICSNSAIARQNLRKLYPSGNQQEVHNTRITLLARNIEGLNRISPNGKTVNLISFTPGTSFERGRSGGLREERALIWVMLKNSELMRGWNKTQSSRLETLLRLSVGERGWASWVKMIDRPDAIDSSIHDRFIKRLAGSAEWDMIRERLGDPLRKASNAAGRREARRIVRGLRNVLAAVSIEALEPDLVILDEFQRFKHLLEVPIDDEDEDDVRSLAHKLFTYDDVKVLLLTGDDHYADFIATIRFLMAGDADGVAALEASFRDYRLALLTGVDVDSQRSEVQDRLVRVMSRTERPTLNGSGMGRARSLALAPPSEQDILGFVALDRAAKKVDEVLPIEYWKSAPYFLNFMDGYKVGAKIKSLIKSDGASILSSGAQYVSEIAVRTRREVPPNNSRLEGLQDDVMSADLWRLLWLPPSLPYLEAGSVYSTLDRMSITKRLVFSSWSAAPNSIASLLSHEATRRIFEGTEENKYTSGSRRLSYRTAGGHAESLSTLALFTPVPALANLADPLELVVEHGGTVAKQADAVMWARNRIVAAVRNMVGEEMSHGAESAPWNIAFMFASKESLLDLRRLGDDDEEDDDESITRSAHLNAAATLGTWNLDSLAPEDWNWVARIALTGPANVAYRSLKRTTTRISPSTSILERAAAIIGEGFRSLFNRAESSGLLDRLNAGGRWSYWQSVLSYCMDGDLQAVTDEYLHHLLENKPPKDEHDIIALAVDIRDSMSLVASPVHLFNPNSPDRSIRINTRFAVRYGSSSGKAKSDEQSENRVTAVRGAFNSPFWPMVLASTSVGQEGVDFHWWCHSLVHWNLPSNPVDLEQREGRIHRFKGHAIRKNVAAAFRDAAFQDHLADPWEAMFTAACRARPTDKQEQMGDMWPWWVFPGEATIDTWTPVVPFSTDGERLDRMSKLRELYRLAFGQPRQQEFLELIAGSSTEHKPLDLQPPR